MIGDWLSTGTEAESRLRNRQICLEFGEPRRNRTYNPQIKSLLLCQLS